MRSEEQAMTAMNEPIAEASVQARRAVIDEAHPRLLTRGLREDETRWRIGLPGAYAHW
jgi:hypothetical protein